MRCPSRGRVFGVGLVPAVALFATTGLAGNILAADSTECRPTEFFVATDGDDRAEGTEQDPFRTIDGARKHVRKHEINSERMRCDVVVNVRAGDYAVDETITFDEKDSGRNGNQVVYRSYDGPGEARMIGADKVTGWEPYQNGIYRAPVDNSFYTLYDNGERATTARMPNRGGKDIWAPYLTSTNPEPARWNTPKWMNFDPADWNQNWDLQDAQLVVWSGNDWVWFTDTVPIQNPSWDSDMITVEHATRYPMTSDEGGSRYFIQNSLDFLDQPGEYYLDHDEKMVYYKPPNGSIEDSEVWAPNVRTVFEFAGSSPEHRVQDVVLDGFAVQYTDFVDWYRYSWNQDGDSGERHKYPQYDRQVELPRNRFGTITVTNAQDLELSRLHLNNTGFTAVNLVFHNENISVSDSLIEHIGGDGIKVEGGWPGEGDISGSHVFTNNYIDHFGELVPGDAAGVELMSTSGNEVSHSVVQHSARYAVSLESRPEVSDQDNYVKGNTFEHLRLAHLGKDSNDMGAFYAYGVDNEDPSPVINTVNQVTIEDVNPHPSVPVKAGHGVHMDFGGCGFRFANIEVTDVQGRTFKGDRDCNEFENNSFDENFDRSKMQYDRIGVSDDFPYPTPEAR